MDAIILIVIAVVVAVAAVAAVTALRRGLETRLAVSDAEVRRLADAAGWRGRGDDEVRREVAGVREALDRMRVVQQERREREEQGWAVMHRLASVLTGSQRTGRAGENVLSEALSHLPPTMLVRDFRVNGRVVECGLLLPDGRRLPLDSKWPAEREVLALEQEQDPVERDRLARLVERAVADRAREVGSYLDPAVTAPLAVAAVPDAAYAVLRRAHAEAYRHGVVVIPYSMAMPVLLFLYGIVSRSGGVTDVQACLSDIDAALDSLESTIENKVARATTMLANATEEMRGCVGKARGTLSRARATGGGDDTAEPEPLLGVVG